MCTNDCSCGSCCPSPKAFFVGLSGGLGTNQAYQVPIAAPPRGGRQRSKLKDNPLTTRVQCSFRLADSPGSISKRASACASARLQTCDPAGTEHPRRRGDNCAHRRLAGRSRRAVRRSDVLQDHPILRAAAAEEGPRIRARPAEPHVTNSARWAARPSYHRTAHRTTTVPPTVPTNSTHHHPPYHQACRTTHRIPHHRATTPYHRTVPPTEPTLTLGVILDRLYLHGL